MSSRADVEAMIAEGLATADDSVREAWDAIAVPPVKWELGRGRRKVWVVGEFEGRVVWYDDYEHAFDDAAFSERGIIDASWSGQHDFADFLGTLPAARVAEAFADERPSAELPLTLAAGGRVGRRQTTYWEVHPREGSGVRIHFSGKVETRFASPAYEAATICDEHPLLLDYREPWSQLYVAGKADDPKPVITAIDENVCAVTHGWRAAREYIERGGSPTDDILRGGHGLLLRAPETIADAAERVLRDFGIRSSRLVRSASCRRVRLLLLGRSYVIAEAFRVVDS